MDTYPFIVEILYTIDMREKVLSIHLHRGRLYSGRPSAPDTHELTYDQFEDGSAALKDTLNLPGKESFVTAVHTGSIPVDEFGDEPLGYAPGEGASSVVTSYMVDGTVVDRRIYALTPTHARVGMPIRNGEPGYIVDWDSDSEQAVVRDADDNEIDVIEPGSASSLTPWSFIPHPVQLAETERGSDGSMTDSMISHNGIYTGREDGERSWYVTTNGREPGLVLMHGTVHQQADELLMTEHSLSARTKKIGDAKLRFQSDTRTTEVDYQTAEMTSPVLSGTSTKDRGLLLCRSSFHTGDRIQLGEDVRSPRSSMFMWKAEAGLTDGDLDFALEVGGIEVDATDQNALSVMGQHLDNVYPERVAATVSAMLAQGIQVERPFMKARVVELFAGSQEPANVQSILYRLALRHQPHEDGPHEDITLWQETFPWVDSNFTTLTRREILLREDSFALLGRTDQIRLSKATNGPVARHISRLNNSELSEQTTTEVRSDHIMLTDVQSDGVHSFQDIMNCHLGDQVVDL